MSIDCLVTLPICRDVNLSNIMLTSFNYDKAALKLVRTVHEVAPPRRCCMRRIMLFVELQLVMCQVYLNS